MATTPLTMEEHARALEQSSDHIVFSKARFYRTLGPYVTLAMRTFWLEAAFYGVANHILTHLALTADSDITNAGFGVYPQAIFTRHFDPEEEEPLSRSHRCPDVATILSYLGAPTMVDAATAPPRLGFWWEMKPHRRRIDQPHLIDYAPNFTHMRQLIEQARYAFAHYGGLQYYAFLSEGLNITFVSFTNPKRDQESDSVDVDASSSSLAALDGTASRKRPRTDDPSSMSSQRLESPLPKPKLIFLGQPLLLNARTNPEINPLVLCALHTAAVSSGATFEPSYMQPPPGYTIPEELTLLAEEAYRQFEDTYPQKYIKEDSPEGSEDEAPRRISKQARDDANAYRGPSVAAGSTSSRRTSSRASTASVSSLHAAFSEHSYATFEDDEPAIPASRRSSSASAPPSRPALRRSGSAMSAGRGDMLPPADTTQRAPRHSRPAAERVSALRQHETTFAYKTRVSALRQHEATYSYKTPEPDASSDDEDPAPSRSQGKRKARDH
ncbi:hypothetical protein FA95DRAFT_1682094 [Auriscalpium vulgare]|uniref:Uncharacterized protein n=1 Tax=Auriscalpium vulgare TaxID=40419 RepID=A0ACB8RGJ3_9AGAM|nr:hypothetical protein FA95DRAFT_1682094 [Auriscalpium vulgare]